LNEYYFYLNQLTRCGYGKYVQGDLSEYEGEWENDLPNGKGKFIFKSGNN